MLETGGSLESSEILQSRRMKTGGEENSNKAKKIVRARPKWYDARRKLVSKSQKINLRELFPKFGKSLKDLEFGRPIDFDEWFGFKTKTRWLDVGFGKGASLLHIAKANPTAQCIGVEIYLPGIAQTIALLELNGISNVRICGGDIRKFFLRHFPEDSFDRISVFFPDPIEERNRVCEFRLLGKGFLDSLASRMKAGGCLNVATDVSNYALNIVESLLTSRNWKEVTVFRSATCHKESEMKDAEQISEKMGTRMVLSRPEGLRPKTSFETKAIDEGRFVFDIQAITVKNQGSEVKG